MSIKTKEGCNEKDCNLKVAVSSGSAIKKGGDMETLQEFANPNSMLTPGVAGAVTMTITNTLSAQFSLNEAVVALICSFMIGLVVVKSKKSRIWKKIIYYILNSLIIFTMAVGTNTLGQVSSEPKNQTSPVSLLEQILVEPLLGTNTASAQPPPIEGWCCLNNLVNTSTQEECEKWGGRFFENHENAAQACQDRKPEEIEEKPQFFRPWFKKK